MSISKILNSLEKSWERDDILLNLKNGLATDEIVNEFQKTFKKWAIVSEQEIIEIKS